MKMSGHYNDFAEKVLQDLLPLLRVAEWGTGNAKRRVGKHAARLDRGGGPGGNRTHIRGFAVRCITTLPPDLMSNVLIGSVAYKVKGAPFCGQGKLAL